MSRFDRVYINNQMCEVGEKYTINVIVKKKTGTLCLIFFSKDRTIVLNYIILLVTVRNSQNISLEKKLRELLTVRV